MGDLGHSIGPETLAERTMEEVYGYTRRSGQSRDFITVPLALVQEAHDAATSGDSKALLAAMLVHGRVHARD